MKFVEEIAAYIKVHDLSLRDLTIVLPSERMKKYLSAALFETYGEPVIAPEMITMDRWIKQHSQQTVIDGTRTLIRLFQIHHNHGKSDLDRSFDEFLSWGITLLSDFNEIDRYLLTARQVFRNLANIKEIEHWSFGEEKLTASQKRFMEFWELLPEYYHALNEALSQENMCYPGKAFRFLSENIDRLFSNEKAHYLFAGFNALSESERSIMRQLDQLGRAHIFIDADSYYFQDKVHEAGRFLRDLSDYLSGKRLETIHNRLMNKSMNVTMISCAQKTGQVKVAASILEQIPSEKMGETLVLLADENLIASVIKTLPANIGQANITLGLPIRNTAIKTWVNLLFSIQENYERFKTKSLYFYDLQVFWNHPFTLAILDRNEHDLLLESERELIRSNRIFIQPQNLMVGSKISALLHRISRKWEGWNEAIETIRSLNELIYEKLSNEFSFEKAILQAFDSSLRDFQNIVHEGLPEMKLKSFKQLFNQHWGTRSIAYYGNPLDGLQVMGLLETRGIDFKRIICIGMNEGQLPPTNPIQSMIPMDLRRFLGLPTPREKQGLFAHHFYRLLHHCEELYVTHFQNDEFMGASEPSRYLLQLEMELSRVNPNVTFQKQIYTLESKQKKAQQAIRKSDEIAARMDQLFAQSTSASMIRTFLTCPLDFYFRYVMDFGEEERIEEEIEHNTFGTFIHNTLEELYRPFARLDKSGKQVHRKPIALTSMHIDRMLKDMNVILTNEFLKHFNNDREAFMKGKNLLSFQMAKELTKRFLYAEKRFLQKQREPVYIEALEKEYRVDMTLEIGGRKKKIRLRGFIDRIDRIGNTVRIIDYKSGKVRSEDVQFFSSRKNDPKNVVDKSLNDRKHTLQLVWYTFLYHQQHKIIPESTIISFVSGNNEPFQLDTKAWNMDELMHAFPEYLTRVLEQVYDTEIPFEHNHEQFMSYCQYCE